MFAGGSCTFFEKSVVQRVQHGRKTAGGALAGLETPDWVAFEVGIEKRLNLGQRIEPIGNRGSGLLVIKALIDLFPDRRR